METFQFDFQQSSPAHGNDDVTVQKAREDDARAQFKFKCVRAKKGGRGDNAALYDLSCNQRNLTLQLQVFHFAKPEICERFQGHLRNSKKWETSIYATTNFMKITQKSMTSHSCAELLQKCSRKIFLASALSNLFKIQHEIHSFVAHFSYIKFPDPNACKKASVFDYLHHNSTPGSHNLDTFCMAQ